jgi:DNA-binding MarR family transcriptional regulator
MPEIISRDSSLYARYLLGKARHFMFQARQKELKPYRIAPRQANTLIILYKLGKKATLVELAKNTDRGINTLSIQMSRMEKDGLVKKVRENPKSNQLRFELTEKGFNTYKKVKNVTSVKTIMSVLSEEQRQSLIAMLESIVATAEKYTPS